MWWHAHQGMGWWMLFGGIWVLLFWGAIIALVVWAIKRLSNGSRDDDPVRIAERRFARGEITREELDRIREALRR